MESKMRTEDVRTLDEDALEAALRAMLAELPAEKLLILVREFEALLEDFTD